LRRREDEGQRRHVHIRNLGSIPSCPSDGDPDTAAISVSISTITYLLFIAVFDFPKVFEFLIKLPVQLRVME
jgi:hypothetical protein